MITPAQEHGHSGRAWDGKKIRWEDIAGKKPTSWVKIFEVLTSSWTWLKDFTWFWFAPTSYSIKIVKKALSPVSNPLWWFGSYDGSVSYASWIQGTQTNTSSSFVARIIDNISPAFLRSQFAHSKLLWDGVQLNCTNLWYDVILEITAYS